MSAEQNFLYRMTFCRRWGIKCSFCLANLYHRIPLYTQKNKIKQLGIKWHPILQVLQIFSWLCFKLKFKCAVDLSFVLTQFTFLLQKWWSLIKPICSLSWGLSTEKLHAWNRVCFLNIESNQLKKKKYVST